MSAVKKFFTPQRLAMMGVFIALQIILARFVGLQISEGLCISFETIPIILASLWLGPVAGGIVGVLSDFLGWLLHPFGVYFIPLAITPLLNGVLPGLAFRYLFKGNMNAVKCIVTVFVSEIIASLLCGTLALTLYYSLFVPNKEAAFWLILVPRLTKFATMTVDAIVVWLLHRYTYKRVIYPMLQGRKR